MKPSSREAMQKVRVRLVDNPPVQKDRNRAKRAMPAQSCCDSLRFRVKDGGEPASIFDKGQLHIGFSLAIGTRQATRPLHLQPLRTACMSKSDREA